MNFSDVREVLKAYSGTHIPTEYARREAIAREQMHKQFAEENPRSKRKSWGGGGGFLNALGLGSTRMMGADGEESLSEGFEKGKTFMDQ
ncbi:MAG: hypothetical protein Q9211_002276, partial [Gyalolechia sp. 1 TL-2023]